MINKIRNWLEEKSYQRAVKTFDKISKRWSKGVEVEIIGLSPLNPETIKEMDLMGEYEKIMRASIASAYGLSAEDLGFLEPKMEKKQSSLFKVLLYGQWGSVMRGARRYDESSNITCVYIFDVETAQDAIAKVLGMMTPLEVAKHPVLVAFDDDDRAEYQFV